MINILNRKTVKYSQNTWKGAGGGCVIDTVSLLLEKKKGKEEKVGKFRRRRVKAGC